MKNIYFFSKKSDRDSKEKSCKKKPVRADWIEELVLTEIQKLVQNDEMIELQVDDTERRIIVRALADLRDKQRLAQKNYDFLDSLIVKVCDADSDKSMSLNRGR